MVETDVGGQGAVARNIGTTSHTGGGSRHQEHADAAGIKPAAGGTRGHKQEVCGRTMQHHALVAIEHPTARMRHGAALAIGQVVARLRLGVGKRQQCLACDHARQQLGALCGAGGVPHETATQYHRGKPGFKRQRTAHQFGNQHHIGGPTIETAVLGRKRQTQEADIGITCPHLARKTRRFCHDGTPRFKVVTFLQKAADAVLQLPLLFGQIEIHVCYNPRKALAMMFFWISLDPP